MSMHRTELRIDDRAVRADFEINGDVSVEAAHLMRERFAEDDEATLVLELRNQAARAADITVDALLKTADGRAVSRAYFSVHEIPPGGRGVDNATVVLDPAVVLVDCVVRQSLYD